MTADNLNEWLRSLVTQKYPPISMLIAFQQAPLVTAVDKSFQNIYIKKERWCLFAHCSV